MRRALIAAALLVSLSGCASMGTLQRSDAQREADRKTLETILQHCEVTITGSSEAAINASVLPSASAGLEVSLGGNCKPVPRPYVEPAPTQPLPPLL